MLMKTVRIVVVVVAVLPVVGMSFVFITIVATAIALPLLGVRKTIVAFVVGMTKDPNQSLPPN